MSDFFKAHMSNAYSPQSEAGRGDIGIGEGNCIGWVGVHIWTTTQGERELTTYLHDEILKMLNERYNSDPAFRAEIAKAKARER